MLWDVVQCHLVFYYRYFGQCVWPIFKAQNFFLANLTLENASDTLS
jgi:hypothetical protein